MIKLKERNKFHYHFFITKQKKTPIFSDITRREQTYFFQ
jgi:hypothetical protein